MTRCLGDAQYITRTSSARVGAHADPSTMQLLALAVMFSAVLASPVPADNEDAPLAVQLVTTLTVLPAAKPSPPPMLPDTLSVALGVEVPVITHPEDAAPAGPTAVPKTSEPAADRDADDGLRLVTPPCAEGPPSHGKGCNAPGI